MEPLGCIQRIQTKRYGIRTKSEFGIHYFGMGLFGYIERIQNKTKWNTNKKSEFGIHSFGMGPLAYIQRIPKQPNGIRTKHEFRIHYFGMGALDILRESRKNQN